MTIHTTVEVPASEINQFGWDEDAIQAFQDAWAAWANLPVSFQEYWVAETTAAKPTNPKDAIGSNKLPLHLWPASATALGCLGMLDGMLKYGRSNFRAIGVTASIYVDAAQRHIAAWFEGEEEDPDSGVPHIAHALACLAIIVDSMAAGTLNDDRMYPGKYREFVSNLTPHVARLKKLHEGKTPKHYTKKDK